jgi:hypothetical protein
MQVTQGSRDKGRLWSLVQRAIPPCPRSRRPPPYACRTTKTICITSFIKPPHSQWRRAYITSWSPHSPHHISDPVARGSKHKHAGIHTWFSPVPRERALLVPCPCHSAAAGNIGLAHVAYHPYTKTCHLPHVAQHPCTRNMPRCPVLRHAVAKNPNNTSLRTITPATRSHSFDKRLSWCATATDTFATKHTWPSRTGGIPPDGVRCSTCSGLVCCDPGGIRSGEVRLAVVACIVGSSSDSSSMSLHVLRLHDQLTQHAKKPLVAKLTL